MDAMGIISDTNNKLICLVDACMENWPLTKLFNEFMLNITSKAQGIRSA